MTAIEILGDKLANLAKSEAADLLAYLKERHQIEPPKTVSFVQEEKKEIIPEAPKFAGIITLEGLVEPSKKINVIKVVREVTGCSLVDGKNFVESAPKTIKENTTKEEAEIIKKKLEDASAKVSIK